MIKKRKRIIIRNRRNIKEPNDEDVVKLALLYFLEHDLLGKEGKNLIDMQ